MWCPSHARLSKSSRTACCGAPTGRTPTSRTTCPTTACWWTSSRTSRRPLSCRRSCWWTTRCGCTGPRRLDMALDKPYLDVPGTTIFDADQSRKGYWLNQFCMSLMKAENRARFKADEDAYLAEWPMTDEQRAAVRARDLNWAMRTGGNIYFLAKLGATDGLSFQQMAGSMTGMTEHQYRDMMIGGGRSAEGNRVLGEEGNAQGPAAQSQTWKNWDL